MMACMWSNVWVGSGRSVVLRVDEPEHRRCQQTRNEPWLSSDPLQPRACNQLRNVASFDFSTLRRRRHGHDGVRWHAHQPRADLPDVVSGETHAVGDAAHANNKLLVAVRGTRTRLCAGRRGKRQAVVGSAQHRFWQVGVHRLAGSPSSARGLGVAVRHIDRLGEHAEAQKVYDGHNRRDDECTITAIITTTATASTAVVGTTAS